MNDIHLDPGVKQDALVLFDVTDGNPNGDPDAGNRPRTDQETGHGLVTDVAVKRWVRDAVADAYADTPGFRIFVEAGVPLEPRAAEGWGGGRDDDEAAVQWLSATYFDIRMFGAVFARKGKGPVSLRGPVQLSLARSLDPVCPVDHAITRTAPWKAGDGTAMAGKWAVPYGLYRARLHYSAPKAAKRAVSAGDLAALWRAIALMTSLGRSASRPAVDLCGLYVFSHADRYGSAPVQRVFGSVRHELADPSRPPRSLGDYRREFHELPGGVTLTPLVDAWA